MRDWATEKTTKEFWLSNYKSGRNRKFSLFAGVAVCLFYLSLAGSESFSGTESEKDPQLVIKSPAKTLIYKRSDLLSRSDLTSIEVAEDPAYSQKKTVYWAVPAYELFQSLEVPKDAAVLFECLDGFSAPISRDKLLSHSNKQSVAYVAIEKENEKWPAVKPNLSQQSAGPFYLIWKNPKASKIVIEEWPYQLKGFEIKKSLREIYPAIFPASNFSENHSVRKGFSSFIKNCFTCHTLNGQGESQMGPDLNIPLSPTEYLKEGYLKTLIRNPQDLRHWTTSRMKGFTESELSNADLNDIIQYLKHMSQRKVTQPVKR
jgi:mono/diheme cytochrome c family protein